MTNETTTQTCKHCGEPIRHDGLHAQYVHIANPKLNSWYTYCEMNRNHADHTTSGNLTPATPDDRNYAFLDSDAKP